MKIPIRFTTIDSLVRFFLIFLGSIAISEIIVMLILAVMPPQPVWRTIVLDVFLLSSLIFPSLYFFMFKPLTVLLAERTLAKEVLRESEEHFRSVAQSANAAIITSSGKGIILGWNRAAEIIFGYTKEEITGKELITIIPPRFVEQHINGMKRIEQGGEHHVIGQTIELTGLHKNGNEFPIELSLAEWEAASGKYFTGIIRDITKRKQGEEERERLITELQSALTEVKTLSGIIPICANCKKIRDDKGYWDQVEVYVSEHTDAHFSHGICPDCIEKIYPEQAERLRNRPKK